MRFNTLDFLGSPWERYALFLAELEGHVSSTSEEDNTWRPMTTENRAEKWRKMEGETRYS